MTLCEVRVMAPDSVIDAIPGGLYASGRRLTTL